MKMRYIGSNLEDILHEGLWKEMIMRSNLQWETNELSKRPGHIKIESRNLEYVHHLFIPPNHTLSIPTFLESSL